MSSYRILFAIGMLAVLITAGVAPAYAAQSKQPANRLTFVSKNIPSIGSQDGWILESTETSNAGGSVNATDSTFRLGDNATNRQYRAILSFNTAPIPDNATILYATLFINTYGLVGKDPFNSFGKLIIDIRNGPFGGNPTLQVTDFNAVASVLNVGGNPGHSLAQYYIALNATGRSKINKVGLTQLRLRFATDDNNNRAADYINIISADKATLGERWPFLMITYTIP